MKLARGFTAPLASCSSRCRLTMATFKYRRNSKAPTTAYNTGSLRSEPVSLSGMRVRNSSLSPICARGRSLRRDIRCRGRQQLIDDRLLQLANAFLVACVHHPSADLSGFHETESDEDFHLFVERRLRAPEKLEECFGSDAEWTTICRARSIECGRVPEQFEHTQTRPVRKCPKSVDQLHGADSAM